MLTKLKFARVVLSNFVVRCKFLFLWENRRCIVSTFYVSYLNSNSILYWNTMYSQSLIFCVPASSVSWCIVPNWHLNLFAFCPGLKNHSNRCWQLTVLAICTCCTDAILSSAVLVKRLGLAGIFFFFFFGGGEAVWVDLPRNKNRSVHERIILCWGIRMELVVEIAQDKKREFHVRI